MPNYTAETTRERPMIFGSPMVKAILAGRKTQTRRVVMPSNSTVLGYPAKSYWPHLLFDHAVAKEKASIMEVICGTEDAPPDLHLSVPYANEEPDGTPIGDMPWYRVRPKWKVGDRLWVREIFDAMIDPGATEAEIRRKAWNEEEKETECWVVDYKADNNHHRIMDKIGQRNWKSPIFMPRWASRITLEVTGVRVERVQEISIEEVIAEGFEKVTNGPHANQYWREETGAKFASAWDKINGPRGFGWGVNPWVWVIEFKRVKP